MLHAKFLCICPYAIFCYVITVALSRPGFQRTASPKHHSLLLLKATFQCNILDATNGHGLYGERRQAVFTATQLDDGCNAFKHAKIIVADAIETMSPLMFQLFCFNVQISTIRLLSLARATRRRPLFSLILSRSNYLCMFLRRIFAATNRRATVSTITYDQTASVRNMFASALRECH